MYKVKMMGGEVFLITEEEMRGMAGKSGLYPISSIRGLINLSSVSLVVPSELIEDKVKVLSDGTRVVKKFGTWVMENNPDIKVDINYYPELKEPIEGERKHIRGNTDFQRAIGD